MNDTEQPVRPPVSSAITVPRLVAICVLVFGLTALSVRCVAVSSQSAGAHSGHGGGTAAKAGPPRTVEQLAAMAGCTPKIQTNAAELRQGYCPIPSGGRYFITTFTTAQGQQQWLALAQDYARAQLVGNRWIVASSPQVLQQLQPRLGGDIVKSEHAHG